MGQRVLAPATIDYPSGDGKPMAEDDWQLRAILDAVGVLDLHFRDCPDAYVSGDLLIDCEGGNPKARVAPVHRVPRRSRRVSGRSCRTPRRTGGGCAARRRSAGRRAGSTPS